MSTSYKNIDYSTLCLRVGLAAVFLYAGIDAFKEPAAWISFIPSFTTRFASAKLSLDIASVIQIIVAIALLAGKYVRYAALVGALLLGGITIFNLNTLLITFRDVGLIFMALALFFASSSDKLSRKK